MHADKSFNDAKGGSWDCKTDPTVTINATGGTYTFTGECKVITVNGNKNTLTLQSLASLVVNGNDNKINCKTAPKSSSISRSNNSVEVGAVARRPRAASAS